ncbi:hypothetical protein A1O7_01605 [Cladophialophora yegresii CBS 114405]|uniref:DUF6314 domain-containing protein n=1 Tax=Cladophialophora yegresii CBS 114405 TaxID=1182544 RepID=W9X457_9EURO|nr:uncharacterized protein A1O7_01605 [Cladophialophora yegresii CBS 114405]EXJ65264.1 hypothetical protein A1O7_01605 [Cladophialophora yegresii CBS 114405]
MVVRPTASALLTRLFEDLPGTWLLNRQLRSADPSEPSGRCAGKAHFTTRPSPSPVVGPDGKLHTADAELLYHEQGEFEMKMATGNNLTSVPTFTFSRKYIWRLQKAENGHTISIWFAKPGTETIDYLFHKIDIPFEDDQNSEADGRLVLHGTGGHLCVEDFYSSSYTFTLSRPSEDSTFKLASWTTVHEVLGPKKDQHIETTFVRS